METKLLKKLLLFTFIIILGMQNVNAQADIEFTFDSTTWEGWTPGGGTAAWSSVFENNPQGQLKMNWHATTKNVVMYRNADLVDVSVNKFLQIKLSNESAVISKLYVRFKPSGGSWTVLANETITQNTAGVYSTYDVDLTLMNQPTGEGNIQIAFRSDPVGTLADGGNDTTSIYIDNILLAIANPTASVKNYNSFEFSMFPNPVKDVLNITTQENLEKVEVFNLLGKKVLSANTKNVDVSSLSKSVYLVKLTSDKGVSTKKLVKN